MILQVPLRVMYVVHKFQKEVNPDYDSMCVNLSTNASQLACEQDVSLTNDGSWACQKITKIHCYCTRCFVSITMSLNFARKVLFGKKGVKVSYWKQFTYSLWD